MCCGCPSLPASRKRKRDDAKASRRLTGNTTGRPVAPHSYGYSYGLACDAIVAAFSCDGVHFSKFLDITPAGDAGAGRTFHQPVDGVLIENGMVYAYVQENVRGLDMDRYDDDPNYPTAPPRVVRYAATRVELERRAIVETRGLAGC